VIVECDKGQDLGLVVELISLDMYIERRAKEQHSGLFDENERVLRHIIKIANQFDLALLPEKFQDESVVVEHANEVVKRVLVLPMQIISAEYQFDRTKLTIHYNANTRVDFRYVLNNIYCMCLILFVCIFFICVVVCICSDICCVTVQ
jgi:cell fate regulator YaaT (PSP1 superfamily)